jgi:hypothetical protein
MCDQFAADCRVLRLQRAERLALVAVVATCLASVSPMSAAAESKAGKKVIRLAASETGNWLETVPPNPFAPTDGDVKKLKKRPSRAPANASAARNRKRPTRTGVREINFQGPSPDPPQHRPLQLDLKKNPCAAMDEKPLAALGIITTLPEGKLPADPATACWNQLNESAGPMAAMRCWPMHVCSWNAPCICHRPLYFEQINLERHGYGCCEPLQPLASAAHFFATIPALPYCMAVECPCECVYTLGHYRPGSCPPWRHHWPPCSPLAAAAEGGVWTGLIFLIP